MLYFLEVFGLNRRCETFNSILIILILFTNKNLACVQTPPHLKKGGGGVRCTQAGYKNVAFIYCEKKEEEDSYQHKLQHLC